MAIMVFLLSLSGSLQSEEPYDLDTVLKGYRESFAWSHNVAFDFVEISESSGDSQSEGHFFNDHGKRMEIQETGVWQVSPEVSGVRAKTLFSEDLDGLFFDETIWGLEGDVVPEDLGPTLDIYESGRDRFSSFAMVVKKPTVASFLGYGPWFSYTPLPDVLTPRNTTLQMEEVEGTRYCVLNASTPEGEIQLWLMPDKDYIMKKCVLTKEAGKHQGLSGGTYSFTNDQGESLQRSIGEITFSQYRYQDGHFFPVEVEFSHVQQFEGGEDLPTEVICRITTIDLDPDFEALHAFEATFSEDSEVTFHKKDGSRFYGFSWEDGKLIAPMDGHSFEIKLGETLSALDATPSEKKAPAKLSLLVDKLDPDAAAQIKAELWLYILTAAGVIVLIIGWIAYRMVKRRRESK